MSLVLNRLDYGNVTLAGILAYLLRHLQSVMNAAARLIAGLPRSAPMSTPLVSLHLLRPAERSSLQSYHTAVCMAWRRVTCPLTFAESPTFRLAVVFDRLPATLSSSVQLDSSQLVTDPFLSRLLNFGTNCCIGKEELPTDRAIVVAFV